MQNGFKAGIILSYRDPRLQRGRPEDSAKESRNLGPETPRSLCTPTPLCACSSIFNFLVSLIFSFPAALCSIQLNGVCVLF